MAILDEKGILSDEFKVPLDPVGLGTLLKRLKKADRVLIEATTNLINLHVTILPPVKQVAISNPCDSETGGEGGGE